MRTLVVAVAQEWESDYLERGTYFLERITGETPSRAITGLHSTDVLLEKARKAFPGKSLEGDVRLLVTDEHLHEVFWAEADPMPLELRQAVRVVKEEDTSHV